jgi:DNA-binding SARP family transcriptional activator
MAPAPSRRGSRKPAEAPLTLHLLGGFEIRDRDAGALGIPRRKAQALLACLALTAGGVQPRERLLALLWPDLPPAQAGNSFRQALFSLRRALAPASREVVTVTGGAVALALDAVDVDVHAFERLIARGGQGALEAAADLYRGDLLDGVEVDEPPFRDWCGPRRERLRLAAQGVFRRLLAQRVERGDVDRALETAGRLLQIDPLAEDVHACVMRLHAGARRFTAALRQYEVCVAALRREMGARPGPELQRLSQQIRRRELPAARPATRSSPFIGRSAEIALLRRALGQAWKGQSQVIAVLGEAGIGKSRLVEEIAAEVRSRYAHVATGRCHETQRILPFGPWLEAVRHGGLVADEDVMTALGSSWRGELSRLLPEVARGTPRAFDLSNHPRLFEAIAHLLDHFTARQPLMLVLEDAHWADEMSLRLLGFVAHRARTLPLAVIVTAREEELVDVPVLQGVLRELDREQRLTRITLAPLGRPSIETLVRALSRRAGTVSFARAPGPELGEVVWSMSAGNPFVAIETVQAYADGDWSAAAGRPPLTERVRDLIGSRLEKLTDRGRELALTAAAIGQPFALPVLRLAAGVAEDEAVHEVEALVERRLLHERDGVLDVAHERIRGAVLETAITSRRALVHRRIAEALVAVHASDLDAHLAAIGGHYLAGDAWVEAAAYLTRAGAHAFTQGGHREAAACYDQALQALAHLPEDRATLGQSIDLLLDLRHALMPLGDDKRIGETLRRAQALADRLGDPRRQAHVDAFLASHHWSSGDHERGFELAGSALRTGERLDDHALTISARYFLGVIHHARGNYREAAGSLRPVRDALAGGLTSGRFGTATATTIFATSYLASSLAELGQFAEGRRFAEEAVGLAEPLHHPFLLVHAYVALAAVDLRQGAVDEVAPRLERLRALRSTGNFPVVFPANEWFLGYAYALAGRAEALPLLERLAASTRSAGVMFYLPLWLAMLAEAYVLGGRAGDALLPARQALALARQRGERGHEGWSLRILGEAYLKEATLDHGAAERALRDALAIAEAHGMEPLRAHCHRGLARVALRQGRAREADDHLAEATRRLRALGMTRWLAG